MILLLLNPVTLFLAFDLLLGRFGTFNGGQRLFYVLSLAGSAALWMFLAWLVRTPHARRNQVFAACIAALYAITTILVYGYRLIAGTMPNYYTFEYLFVEPYNNWTILRDSWRWSHTLAIAALTAVFWLGFNRWRVYFTARCHIRRHAFIAAINLTLAVIIQLVLHNNIRFVDQCFTADMTMSTGVMRNVYTRLADPHSGRSGLSARIPMEVPPLETRHKQNTLIILTESLRADAIGAYGSRRATTPFLDSLMAGYTGVVVRFENAYASATMTYVAVPTLLTGVSPLASALALHTQPIFWEYQKALGRETFFFTSQSQEWENIKTFFTVPSIDHYFNKESSGIASDNDLGIDDRHVVDHFIGWLESRISRGPFAGVLQLNQTHYPYWTPDSLRPFGIADRRDRYDNAVHYTDGQLRRMMDALSRRDLLDNTTIIMTADHGEAFNEHGINGHLNCLYREGIRVPFIWFVPGEWARDNCRTTNTILLLQNTERNISTLDIVPTLLDFDGVWRHESLQRIRTGITGQSLLEPVPEGRIVVTSNLTEMNLRHHGLSLVSDYWHYILNLQGERMGVEELYDWRADPGETHNIIDDIPPELRARIDEYLSSYPASQRLQKSLTSK